MSVVWAAMLVAFFCLLRKDNIAVAKADNFNTRLNLCRKDVQVKGGDVLVTLRHTKTIQLGDRVHTVVAHGIPGHVLDVKAAVVCALEVGGVNSVQASGDDPAFAYVQNGVMVPLTHKVFVDVLKHCLSVIGVNPAKYSGHSFRRGGATFALKRGVDPLYIKWVGDWKSNCYELYLDRCTPESMTALPRAMAEGCSRLP